MNSEPILFSLAHYREIILAAFDLAGVKRFVEIGSQYGSATEQLCAYAERVGGRLITIDPAPQPDALEFIKTHQGQPHFEFIKSTSLAELPNLRDMDAYIIDGDHNYYTVSHELEEIAKNSGTRPWLVFAHDVGWPCGRRDMYYAPERIPADARHPYRYNVGVSPDSPEPFPGGFGDVPGLAIAIKEGGPRNGVRTAIEDFLAGRPDLRLDVMPAIFGVGVIYPRTAPWAQQLAELLHPFVNSPLLERMEQNRVWLSVQLLHHYHLLEVDKQLPAPEFPPGQNVMEVFRAADRETFSRLWDTRFDKVIEAQSALSPGGTEPFNLTGVCAVCGGNSNFTSDFMFASPDATGRVLPAWRERQICSCRLNCRQRSCFQLLKDSLGLTPTARIYCSEQQTDLYRHVQRIFPRTVGSEFYGDRFPLGSVNPDGIRNEDVTRLTFPDASFDCIFSLDVMEHVPNYRAGFREMARCLKPGGKLLLTAPFHFDKDTTVVRASVNPDGSLQHHLPPVYHGDPINPKGALCFNDFGWDLVDDMRAAGFGDVTVFVFTAPQLGYIGLQYIFLATHCPAEAAARNNFRWPQTTATEHRPAIVAPRAAGNSRPETECFKFESPGKLRCEADELFEACCWDAAAQRYKVLAARFPNELHVWHRQVQCLQNQGFQVSADLVREEAIEQHPDWAGALNAGATGATAADLLAVEGRSYEN